jgi:ribosomal protein L37AE/L43A
VGQLLEGPTPLCRQCYGRLDRTVPQLPADVATLTELIGASENRGEGAKVSGSRELPTPLRLGIEALRAEIDWELIYWAECLGMEAPIAMRLPARVARSAQWVGNRLDPLLALGPQERTTWTAMGEPAREETGDRHVVETTGLAGALHLMTLHRRVRVVAGRTRLTHRLKTACSSCQQAAIVRHDGASTVLCENCGTSFDDLDWFVRVTAAAAA